MTGPADGGWTPNEQSNRGPWIIAGAILIAAAAVVALLLILNGPSDCEVWQEDVKAFLDDAGEDVDLDNGPTSEIERFADRAAELADEQPKDCEAPDTG